MAVDLGSDALSEFAVDSRISLQVGNLLGDLRGHLHFAVLLFLLVDTVGFKICIVEEAGADGLEASVRDWEEDAANVDFVAGIHETSEIATDVDCHGPWNVTDRNLVGLQRDAYK